MSDEQQDHVNFAKAEDWIGLLMRLVSRGKSWYPLRGRRGRMAPRNEELKPNRAPVAEGQNPNGNN